MFLPLHPLSEEGDFVRVEVVADAELKTVAEKKI
jgi:hypothetical protein